MENQKWMHDRFFESNNRFADRLRRIEDILEVHQATGVLMETLLENEIKEGIEEIKIELAAATHLIAKEAYQEMEIKEKSKSEIAKIKAFFANLKRNP